MTNKQVYLPPASLLILVQHLRGLPDLRMVGYPKKLARDKLTSGLYYKHITIVNDAARAIRMMIVRDATTWSVIYDRN
jgi:hypothetical protein